MNVLEQLPHGDKWIVGPHALGRFRECSGHQGPAAAVALRQDLEKARRLRPADARNWYGVTPEPGKVYYQGRHGCYVVRGGVVLTVRPRRQAPLATPIGCLANLVDGGPEAVEMAVMHRFEQGLGRLARHVARARKDAEATRRARARTPWWRFGARLRLGRETAVKEGYHQGLKVAYAVWQREARR